MRRIVESRGAKASLERWLFDEHPPSGPVDCLVGAQHLGSVGVAPARHRARFRRTVFQSRSHLRQLGEARLLQHQVFSG